MSEKYYYAVARTAELENKLLPASKIEQMAEASDAAAALRLLSGTVYGEAAERLSGPQEFEKLITGATLKLFSYIREVCPQRQLADMYLVAYDVANLKVLLRCEKLGEAHPSLLSEIGIHEPPALESAFADGDFSQYPEKLGEAVQTVRSQLAENSPPSVIDPALDAAQFAIQLEYASQLGSRFMIDYVRSVIDLTNLRDFLRIGDGGKAAFYPVFIDGGKLGFDFFDSFYAEDRAGLSAAVSQAVNATLAQAIDRFFSDGSLSELEKECGKYLPALLKEGKKNPFGPEALAYYISAITSELDAIRVVMVGKINNIPTAAIKARLRLI